MLELVPECGSDASAFDEPQAAPDPRPSATVHYIYDPLNPSINAIVSVARRLQEVLLEHGAIPDGVPLPCPMLAPTNES